MYENHISQIDSISLEHVASFQWFCGKSLFETQRNLHIKNSFDHFSDEFIFEKKLEKAVKIWHHVLCKIYCYVKCVFVKSHWFNFVGARCIIFIRPNKYFKTDVTFFQMGFVRKLAQFIYVWHMYFVREFIFMFENHISQIDSISSEHGCITLETCLTIFVMHLFLFFLKKIAHFKYGICIL